MSTDTKVKEPVDDAVVVNDEERAETSHKELVGKVSKMLNRDEWGDEKSDAKSGVTDEPDPVSTAAETKETPPEPKDKEPEAKDETPAQGDAPISDDMKTRAEKAGFTTELAEQLHQSGQLENTLAAFDRALVERFQAPKPEEKSDTQEVVEEQTEEMPELDPDIYDEEIVKRDKYHKQRIDALEAQLETLLQDREDAFEARFDGVLSELGYDIKDEEKCARTFKAYKGLCEANDVSPEKCDRSLIERAHAAMYPEDVKKRTQQETVNRLRDAEGKFLSSAKSTGAPPARDMSPEEVHDQLVSNVATYLKKSGVEMSGI